MTFVSVDVTNPQPTDELSALAPQVDAQCAGRFVAGDLAYARRMPSQLHREPRGIQAVGWRDGQLNG